MTRGQLTALTLILFACVPQVAAAGTYEVRSCDFAAEFENNAWAPTNESSSSIEQAQVCPSGGGQFNGLRTFDRLGSSNTPAATEAAFHFVSPTGTSIAGARLKRWIGKDTSDSWIPFIRADGVILETCTISGGAFSCEVGAAGGTEQQYTGLSASRLSVGVRCGQVVPNTCSTGGTIHHVWAVLYGASVVVSDPDPPAVSADPGSPVFSGWIRGARQVALTAADAESGVRELQIFDGAQVRHSASVDQALGGCGTPNAGPAYTFAQPCAAGRGVNGARTLDVDTTSWPSGVYPNVHVRALDAGGEVGQAGPFQVRVDNDPPTNVRFSGLPANLRARAGRRLKGITVTADDPHSGVAHVDLEWRDLDRPGSAWRAYVAGSEPVARAGHRYQLRARVTDQVGNQSADEYSAGVHAVRGPAAVIGARLRAGRIILVARAPRRRAMSLGLQLRSPGVASRVRLRLTVRGRIVRSVRLPAALQGRPRLRLTVRYRRDGRLRARSARVTAAGARLRLPL